MDELITRHLMSETAPEEEAALLDWRRSDAANEAHYRRRRRLWELLEKARGSAPHGAAPRAAELIARAGIVPLRGREGGEARAAGDGEPGRPARGSFLWTRIVPLGALAAASLAAIVLALSSPEPAASLGAVEFITGPREVNTLRLDDGTIVRLAPGSRLEFENHSPRVRQVRFEGVAFFAVAKDAARPFVIRTQGGDAVVLGTRFELRTNEDETRVVVVEGKVALESEGERKEVTSSQMGHVRADRPPTVVDVERVDEFLGWVGGLLVFQSTPLTEVARELAKHYGVEIEIRDSELGRREVTAWLQEQSFDAALTAVCGAVGAACSIRPDRAVMSLPRRADRLTGNSPRGTRN